MKLIDKSLFKTYSFDIEHPVHGMVTMSFDIDKNEEASTPSYKWWSESVNDLDSNELWELNCSIEEFVMDNSYFGL
ncbi:MAG: hypothetical protein EBS55_15165 [Flavobacteriaceae bacterium]|nr:hypothetical protein [Flavobacteriaceae bacterium]